MTDPATQPPSSRTHDSHPPALRVLDENQLDLELLRRKLGALADTVGVEFKQTVIHVTRENLLTVIQTLRDEPELAFSMLTDITAVDNMRRSDFDPGRRFTLVHILYSVTHRKRVRIESRVPEDDPRAPSAYRLFKGAAWIEREVYDMFGITFDNHPDLRRVLMPDYYEHYPLRKDYPLTGRGERDNFVRAEEVE
jgi:NADH/F420H2 dehydrogenase subunit C